MLAVMDLWLIVAIAFIAGLLIGALTVWIMSHRGREGGENARRLRRELDGYSQAVSEHFEQTAELVHAFDQSYKAVYTHLERGAARLVGREAVRSLARDTETDGVPATEAAPLPLPDVGAAEANPTTEAPPEIARRDPDDRNG